MYFCIRKTFTPTKHYISILSLIVLLNSHLCYAQSDSIVSQRYITYLPHESIDSVWEYAATAVVPIIYKVNLHHLVPNQQLDTIARIIDNVRDNPVTHFRYVYVGGSASPEGPVWWNKDLGRYRSGELVRFLLKSTTLKEEDMHVENLMEDWGSTVRTLKSERFSPPEWFDTQKVLGIIATESDWVKRKQKIRDIDKGRTWRWMVRTIFPAYRNSRLVIVCEKAPQFPISILPLSPADSLSAVISYPIRPLQLPVIMPEELPMKFFAVKNNIAFDAALVANIGFEMELWPHTSIDIPFYYSPYDITETWRIRLLGIQPEFRYWSHEAGKGFFAGVHGTVMGFNVSLNTDGRYQDPNHAMWGLGIGGGWATHLDRKHHWGLEINAGFGFLSYQYRSYHNWYNGPQYGGIRKNTWWGPTRIGVTASYKWYRQRRTRRGIR